MDKFTQKEDISKIKLELLGKFLSLRAWITNYSGLGMQNIIDSIFEKYKSNIRQEDLKRLISGIEILKKTNMGSQVDKKISKKAPGGISNLKLIYDDKGEWSYLNKLNTNYTAVSYLLVDLIAKGIINNPELGMKVYQSIMDNPSEGLLKLKPHMERLLNKYFPNIEDYTPYIDPITRTTKIGDDCEGRAIRTIKNSGYKIIFQGGNGDFIDMIFGVDIIAYRDDVGYKTIQVKSYKPNWEDVAYYLVDWIATGVRPDFYDLKTKTEIARL